MICMAFNITDVYDTQNKLRKHELTSATQNRKQKPNTYWLQMTMTSLNQN